MSDADKEMTRLSADFGRLLITHLGTTAMVDVLRAHRLILAARDLEWRAAVERLRGTIPRESDEFERALAAIGDAVLNNVLAAMEGR